MKMCSRSLFIFVCLFYIVNAYNIRLVSNKNNHNVNSLSSSGNENKNEKDQQPGQPILTENPPHVDDKTPVASSNEVVSTNGNQQEPEMETTTMPITVSESITTETANMVDTTPVDALNKVEHKINETKWEVLWKDDFNGPKGEIPSRDNWIFDIGYSYPGNQEMYWGNNEAQYYTDDPENVSTDGNGCLVITPLKDEHGNWTSARIETKRTNFKPPKGGKMAIEGRIHMPDVHGESAEGYWPALWALGSPFRGVYNNWPSIGELDVMENVNGLDYVWGVLHCGSKWGGPCNEKNGLGNRRPCPGNSCQSDFHTYRFEWDESKSPVEFRWFVDGEQYHSVTPSTLGDNAWQNMSEHEGYFILLNVAIGGAFPNALVNHKTPTDKTEPGHPMKIDYVAVYTSEH